MHPELFVQLLTEFPVLYRGFVELYIDLNQSNFPRLLNLKAAVEHMTQQPDLLASFVTTIGGNDVGLFLVDDDCFKSLWYSNIPTTPQLFIQNPLTPPGPAIYKLSQTLTNLTEKYFPGHPEVISILRIRYVLGMPSIILAIDTSYYSRCRFIYFTDSNDSGAANQYTSSDYASFESD